MRNLLECTQCRNGSQSTYKRCLPAKVIPPQSCDFSELVNCSFVSSWTVPDTVTSLVLKSSYKKNQHQYLELYICLKVYHGILNNAQDRGSDAQCTYNNVNTI